MIIVGAMGQDEVGPVRANLGDHAVSQLQCGLELTIREVPGDPRRTNDAGGRRGLFPTNHCKLFPTDLMMPRRTVRDRDHFDLVAQLAIQRREAAGVELGVIRVGTQDQQTKGRVGHEIFRERLSGW